MTEDTYMHNQKRYFRANIIALNPQLMVTFGYERWATIDQMRSHIINFGDQVTRQVLRGNRSRFAETDRLSLIGVAEDLDTKPQIYAAVLGHPLIIDFLLGDEAAQLWRGVHNCCGDFHAAKMRNRPATASYFHARLHLHDTVDRSIRYAPWRPAPIRAVRR
ncbi:hypothetical protein HEQ75_27590 [Roseomonas sp. BU-1]|uniref:Bro-N domain-containing protein n=1 Tax=Falsiroseomonas selenitidurans TaxID=2716335 RepID=A0ABX1EBM7_9PROT|nr:hypothetical protein [Falsiroseomonas selenitidurans]